MGRSLSPGGWSGGFSLLWLIPIGVLALGGLLAVFAVMQMRDRARQQWRRFDELAERAGLGDEERCLLRNIAIGAAVKNPGDIFNSEADFYRGVGNVTGDRGASNVFKGTASAACTTCRFYSSLRRKLGLADPQAELASPGAVSLGPVEAGATLSAMRQRAPYDLDLTVLSMNLNAGELTLEPGAPANFQTGEALTLRYADGGMLWEFSAHVVAVDEHGGVRVHTSGEVRHVNRRRFNRTVVNRPARVAKFPFEEQTPHQATPTFMDATLTELAGTGALLTTDLQAEVGDRVLLMLELRGKTVGTVATVRRRNAGAKRTMAVELIALDTSQVAQLAQETNALARPTRQERDQAAETEPNLPGTPRATAPDQQAPQPAAAGRGRGRET